MGGFVGYWGFLILFCVINFIFNYSFFRERGRDGKREGEKHQFVASFSCPFQGLNPQSRRVP